MAPTPGERLTIYAAGLEGLITISARSPAAWSPATSSDMASPHSESAAPHGRIHSAGDLRRQRRRGRAARHAVPGGGSRPPVSGSAASAAGHLKWRPAFLTATSRLSPQVTST